MNKAGVDETKFLNLLDKIQQDAIKAGEQMVKDIPREALVWDVMCLAGGYIASFLVTVFPTGTSDGQKQQAAAVYQEVLQKVARALKEALEAM